MLGGISVSQLQEASVGLATDAKNCLSDNCLLSCKRDVKDSSLEPINLTIWIVSLTMSFRNYLMPS